MIHTYIDAEKAKAELIKVYKENEGRISIAFNFNTVHFNEIGAGEHYDKIVKILIKLSSRGAKLLCYHPDVDRNHHLDHPNIEKELFLLNLDAVFCSAYPDDADLILDQRCGLAQVYDELNSLLEIEL